MTLINNVETPIDVPNAALNSNVAIPVIGLGTAFGTRSRAASVDVETLVYEAIEQGYRHLDCARCYTTEDHVGRALARHIAQGHIQRKDVFITSKLFGSYHHPDQVEPCLRQSLKSLQTDYVDLYLVHSPCAINIQRKRDENGLFYPDNGVDFMDTWREFERLYEEGVVKSIGVSNFNTSQLQRLLKECSMKPEVNQIESHPHFNNDDLVQFCQQHGIHVTAYSPFGSDGCAPLSDPTIQEIATRHRATPAQVCLRFALQRELSAVPRTKTLSRLASNLSAARVKDGFVLSDDEMAVIRALSRPSGRRIALKEFANCKDYPFQDEQNGLSDATLCDTDPSALAEKFNPPSPTKQPVPMPAI